MAVWMSSAARTARSGSLAWHDGRAEEGEDAVAEEVGDGTAVTLDGVADDVR